MALRNLLVRVGADLSGLQKGMKQAKTEVNNFGKSVNKSLSTIGSALATLGAGLFIKNGMQDAMKFEALMGTLGESLGASIKDFEKWQNTVGASLGFSKLQSAELANMLSLNFKQIATSQQDLLNKTTKMMETAALIANKRGMAMSEVSDRIRSAMNQEADGADELGVNVRVSAIEQSKAYQEMANGTPWAELSSNMQKAILYHHILQSVSTNLGDTLQNNTAMKMSAFTASLADVRLALGQAFLPILSTVLPLLTAFMRRIEGALQFVAAFSRALFGGGGKTSSAVSGIKAQTKATQDQAIAVGGLGDATEKAGKQAKKAGKDAKGSVASFDQVHQLADTSGSSGGSGGAGGGGGGVSVPNLIDTSGDQGGIFDNIGKKAKEFAEKFKKWFAPLGEAWGRLKQSIADLWNSPAIVKFRKWVAGGWGAGFEGIILIVSGAFDILAGAIDIVNSLLNGDWKKAWDGVGKILYGFWEIITGTIGPLFPGLTKKMKEFGDDFKKRWDAIKNINYAELFLKLLKWFTDLKTNSAKKWEEIKSNISTVWTAIKSIVSTKATETWNSFKAPFVGAYSWFKTNVIDKIANAFASIKDAFSGSITNGFKKVYNTAVGWLNSMITSINKIKIPGVWEGVNISKIPALAKGGITNGPTLALIGDNPGGQEVVSPLDKLQGIVVNSMLTAMKTMNMNNNSTGGDIILNIDGRQFARIVKPHLDKESKRVGANVKLNPI